MTAIPDLHWPTKDEYDLAIMDWQQTIWDADIQGSTLAYDEMGIHRYGGANLYVCIYKIGDWMVRCFCTNPPHMTPPDILERYVAISNFCDVYADRVSALLPVTYVERGITVGKRILPLVKTPFLTGVPSLGEFIADNYENQALMMLLSGAWFQMIRELEAIPMAHGDLDLTNVLVEQQGPHIRLRLLDYDNMWIPKLAHLDQTEYGHEAFQHPHFFNSRTRPYTAEMDRFSALVMYVSLKMLSHRPELYAEWGADESEQLLLSGVDYQNAGLATSRIAQLNKLCRPGLRPYIAELNACLREKRMPHSLTQIATSGHRPQSRKQAHDIQNEMETVLSTQSLPVASWEQKILNGASTQQVTSTAIVPISHIPDEEIKIAAPSIFSRISALMKREVAPLTFVICILLSLLLAFIIVAIILFSTHVISLASSQSGQSLAISRLMYFMLHSHTYVQGDMYVAA